jgi:hypothetical protein
MIGRDRRAGVSLYALGPMRNSSFLAGADVLGFNLSSLRVLPSPLQGYPETSSIIYSPLCSLPRCFATRTVPPSSSLASSLSGLPSVLMADDLD